MIFFHIKIKSQSPLQPLSSESQAGISLLEDPFTGSSFCLFSFFNTWTSYRFSFFNMFTLFFFLLFVIWPFFFQLKIKQTYLQTSCCSIIMYSLLYNLPRVIVHLHEVFLQCLGQLFGTDVALLFRLQTFYCGSIWFSFCDKRARKTKNGGRTTSWALVTAESRLEMQKGDVQCTGSDDTGCNCMRWWTQVDTRKYRTMKMVIGYVMMQL